MNTDSYYTTSSISATMNTLQQYDSVIAAMYLRALSYKHLGRSPLVTKVQKLLYIAYGHFIANEKGYQFINEQPRVWPYGPVFPKTRNNIDYETVNKVEDEVFNEISKDRLVTDVLTKVVKKYSHFPAGKLSSWSHAKDGPWDKVKNSHNFTWNKTIPNQYIKEYFSGINVL